MLLLVTLLDQILRYTNNDIIITMTFIVLSLIIMSTDAQPSTLIASQ